MKGKIITEEQKRFKLNVKLVESQKNKKFEYSLDDFLIYDSQWKHYDWKTWCKGANRYDHTKKIVKRYIAECKKPYGQRNLDFIHLV